MLSARDVDGAPRSRPEVADEAGEIGDELTLELRDLAGGDELAQPALDAGTASATSSARLTS